MPVRLPECSLRVLTETDGIIYCRHDEIRSPTGLLPAAACGVCPVRLLPCQNPRPATFQEFESRQTSLPPMSVQIWNLAEAVRDFVSDGFHTVSATDLQRRLEICDTCPRRAGNRCTACGCNLSLKARGRAFHCPENRWPPTTSH